MLATNYSNKPFQTFGRQPIFSSSETTLPSRHSPRENTGLASQSVTVTADSQSADVQAPKSASAQSLLDSVSSTICLDITDGLKKSAIGRHCHDRKVIPAVTKESWEEVRRLLELHGHIESLRLSYSEPDATITIQYGATPAHDALPAYILSQLHSIQTSLKLQLEAVLPTTDLSLVYPDGREGIKQCDGGIRLASSQHDLPGILFEVGLSETYLDLQRDAWDWLWGSDKLVQLVILLKFRKPPPDDDDEFNPSKWLPAFLEVWERGVTSEDLLEEVVFRREKYTEIIRRRGDRLLLRIDDYRQQQGHLALYSKDLLGDQDDEQLFESQSSDSSLSSQSEPPTNPSFNLPLRALSKSINKSIRRMATAQHWTSLVKEKRKAESSSAGRASKVRRSEE